MEILDPIGEPATGGSEVSGSQLAKLSAVGRKAIGHNPFIAPPLVHY